MTVIDTNTTNLPAARSRIRDTDHSASTAMLAQANQSQQNVLSLLKS